MTDLRRRISALALFAFLWPAAPAGAAEELRIGPDARQSLSLTVYNQNLAMVSERRRVSLGAGANRLAILGVSPQIRTETLSLGGDGLTLLEQAFEANLLSAPDLLQRALGGPVWVKRQDDEGGGPRYEEATLVSLSEPPLVRIGERLEAVARNDLAFPAALAEGTGLRARPLLTALVESESAGPHDLSIGYLTGGLGWQADYVGVVAADADRLALTALVTLTNNSGNSFDTASLRLVAGDVSQVPGAPQPRAEVMAMAAAPKMARDMEQAPVGDLHVYSLDRPVSLPDRSTKQVPLLSAPQVEVVREYRFEGLVNAYGGAREVGPVHAAVVLSLHNEQESGLGRPLPAGVMRIYQAGADGSAEVFLGEDRIGHSPEGAELRLNIGRAFDVTAKAKQTDFERLSDKSHESAQAITVKNAKESAVEVQIVGDLPLEWRMVEESQPHERESATRVIWRLQVPAKDEATLSYRVRITRR
jgi:hypothetical protein